MISEEKAQGFQIWMNDPLAVSSDLSSTTRDTDSLRVRIRVASVRPPPLPVRHRAALISLPPSPVAVAIHFTPHVSVSLSILKPSFLELANIYQSMSQIHDIDKGKKLKMAHAMKRRRGEEGRVSATGASASFFVSVVLGFLSFLWFRVVVPAALQTHFSLGSAQKGEHETRVRCAGES